jgi:Protein of unknown function (DUF1059)
MAAADTCTVVATSSTRGGYGRMITIQQSISFRRPVAEVGRPCHGHTDQARRALAFASMSTTANGAGPSAAFTAETEAELIEHVTLQAKYAHPEMELTPATVSASRTWYGWRDRAAPSPSLTGQTLVATAWDHRPPGGDFRLRT